MTFSEEYIQILERVFDLAKNGLSEKIESDITIPKMFGAWSNILWALPHFEKFGDLTSDELKQLVRSLIISHKAYQATTNQYLRTETINWIAGVLKTKLRVEEIDNIEGLSPDQWVRQQFENT